MDKVCVSVFAVCLAGCSPAPKPSPSAVPTTPVAAQWSDAVVTDSPRMDFIKVFHIQMTPQVSLVVTSDYRPWLDSDCDSYACSFGYEMQQGDDPKKWVDFDCDAVAEKIIQTNLVPLASTDCKVLRDEAIRYWKDHSDPDEFTDLKGRVWVRKS